MKCLVEYNRAEQKSQPPLHATKGNLRVCSSIPADFSLGVILLRVSNCPGTR
uniref:Uncharacterized protein n=1 Tax=Rhizophora mucronata TaxID=61149 RepID=A0A2P2NCP3_RHIMU